MREGRTETSVYLLDKTERIGEIARMLGGADGEDSSAKSHASSMLEAADAWKRRGT